jgi:PmbA protein
MEQNNDKKNQTLVSDLVQECLRAGADSAEVSCVQSSDLSIDVRNNAIENSGFSESKSINVRVFVGQQTANVSGSDFSVSGLREMIERAVTNAKIVPSDSYAGLPDPSQLFMNYTTIDDICDPQTPELNDLKTKALETESAALSVKGITNSEGAGCSFGRYHLVLGNSHGFCGSYSKTMTGLSCSVLAGTDTNMQRDYDYSTACLFANLKNPTDIGLGAANRTLKKLNPVKMKSGAFPIIFDRRIGRSFLGYFASSISADSISRGVSFLGNAIGEQIFSAKVHIIDNPHLVGGLSSIPFDGEGVYNPILDIVENGILKQLFTHTISSRKMNIPNNGRAYNSTSPSATNMYMQAGNISPTELYADIDYGFYVTETIGHGLNEVTGDYSIGASGFLIEKGEITIPISEVTIAGNLKDVFKNMIPANDLIFDYSKNIPTIRVDCLTIAGE